MRQTARKCNSHGNIERYTSEKILLYVIQSGMQNHQFYSFQVINDDGVLQKNETLKLIENIFAYPNSVTKAKAIFNMCYNNGARFHTKIIDRIV